MDNSFDERCETDISDCFEDILEGEEEVFYFFYLGNLIMKVIHYAVCSPTNAFFSSFFPKPTAGNFGLHSRKK